MKKSVKIAVITVASLYLLLFAIIMINNFVHKNIAVRNQLCARSYIDYSLDDVKEKNQNVEWEISNINKYYISEYYALYANFKDMYPDINEKELKENISKSANKVLLKKENENYCLTIYGGQDWANKGKGLVCFYKRKGEQYSYPILFSNYVDTSRVGDPEQYEDEDRVVRDLIMSQAYKEYFKKANNGKHLYFGFCMNEHNSIEILGKKVEKIEKVEIRDGYYFWYIEDDGEISQAVESAWKYGEATFADMIKALGIKVG